MRKHILKEDINMKQKVIIVCAVGCAAAFVGQIVMDQITIHKLAKENHNLKVKNAIQEGLLGMCDIAMKVQNVQNNALKEELKAERKNKRGS